MLFPGQIGQGPRLGATYSSLPHCESLEVSTIARQGLWLQGRVCLFPIVCSSWLWALMPPFRICVFQGSAVRLGGASPQGPSLPPHPSYPGEAAHLPGLAQEAPRRRMPTWSHGPCPLAGVAGVFSGGLDP